MLNDKKFLTLNQQMKYLRTDKKIICNGSKNKKILSRIGYFNLINGYKEPFVKNVENDVHVYFTGTNIEELYAVKKFDDELRLLLFKYITQIEEEVRAVTAYKYDDVNERGKKEWHKVDAYEASVEIPKIEKTVSDINEELSKVNRDYIDYYLNKHHFIPTWIMVKVIHFYTFIKFLEFSKNPVKNAVASLYGIFDDRGVPDFKVLVSSLHWLRTVRNACAHNERVFMLKQKNSRVHTDYMNSLAPSYSKERNRKIIDLLVYMKYYLSEKDYNSLIKNFIKLLTKLSQTIHNQAFDKVRVSLGIKDVNHINELRSAPKITPIDYCKIDKL